MIDRNFWKGKRVFITGHTGFKGSWLSSWLLELGATIHGFSLPLSEANRHFNLLQLSQKMDSTFGDLKDFDAVKKTINHFKPDIVIHMAAQALVIEGYLNPVETFLVNTLGTVNLLEACRDITPVKAIVNVTTDKVYENYPLNIPNIEDSALGGHDPYSASKACSEIITSSYRSSFFPRSELGHSHSVRIATARAGNVIGGGDWGKHRLIPDLIRSLENNETLALRSPLSVRPWQHVLDPIKGYLLLAQYLYESDSKYEKSFNFGPSPKEKLTVEDVVKHISLKTKITVNYTEPNFKEEPFISLNSSKAEKILKWKYRWSSHDSIEMTIDWYLRYFKGENTFEITKSQIKEFENEN
jgi:CDP-glucose 4,6-dehydratase